MTSNNNFYANGSWDVSYIDLSRNVDINPNFTNLIDFVPQNNMDVFKITGVDYDYNGLERSSITTAGAVEIN